MIDKELVLQNCLTLIKDIKTANDVNIEFSARLSNAHENITNIAAFNGGVVLNPAYIEQFSQPELAFIFAHEMAHLLYKHSAKQELLMEISTYIRESINGVCNQKLRPDTIFYTVIGKRFEHEADLLGASMANKANYYAEISALEKMNQGLFALPYFADEHPFVEQRIQFLLQNPYPAYSAAEVTKEYLVLNDLSLKIKNNAVTPEVFSLMSSIEAQYVLTSHVNLLETRTFLENRRQSMSEALSMLTFSENRKLYNSFSMALKEYEEILKDKEDVAVICVLHEDAEEILKEATKMKRMVSNNFKHSFKVSAKKVLDKVIGDNYER